MPLIDTYGRPLKASANLTKRLAEPGVTGIRPIFFGTAASGLTPVRLASILRACDQGEMSEFLTLFYLDPPYWGSEDSYGKTLFVRDDFQRLSDALATIKGGFVLSINDVPDIREMFSWARIEAVETTYTIGSKPESRGVRGELIIRSGSL